MCRPAHYKLVRLDECDFRAVRSICSTSPPRTLSRRHVQSETGVTAHALPGLFLVAGVFCDWRYLASTAVHKASQTEPPGKDFYET